MPQNETLIPDSRTASRWHPSRERLDRGAIRVYQQQVGHLAELDPGRLPGCYRTYLYATHPVASDTDLEPHVEVHRRYRREWERSIADARRRGLPWATLARLPALAGGAAP